MRIYEKGGIKVFATPPRVIKLEQTLILKYEQSGRIKKLIIDDLPEQPKISFVPWSRNAGRHEWKPHDLYLS